MYISHHIDPIVCTFTLSSILTCMWQEYQGTVRSKP